MPLQVMNMDIRHEGLQLPWDEEIFSVDVPEKKIM
jgi:hypothetical protein